MNESRILKLDRRLPFIETEELKLDIGCGHKQAHKEKGFIGLDIYDFGQEILWDFEEGLPFPDGSVDEIICEHVLEHVSSPISLLNEFHRVLKINGFAFVIVPHVDHLGAYEMTHLWQFNEESFRYLTRGELIERYGAKQWKFHRLKKTKRDEVHAKMIPIK